MPLKDVKKTVNIAKKIHTLPQCPPKKIRKMQQNDTFNVRRKQTLKIREPIRGEPFKGFSNKMNQTNISMPGSESGNHSCIVCSSRPFLCLYDIEAETTPHVCVTCLTTHQTCFEIMTPPSEISEPKKKR